MTTTTSTPTALRALAAGAALALAAVALSGCSLLSFLPGSGSGSGGSGGGVPADSELIGTTWSGIDSDTDEWSLELQQDGTVGLVYNGNSFDDAGDTWSQSGDSVSMHIQFDDGPIDMVGQFAGLNAPMEMNGSYDGGTFTLTLTRD